jgi:hypothetical protein
MLPVGVVANQTILISPMQGRKLAEWGLHWLGFGENLKFHQSLKFLTHQGASIQHTLTQHAAKINLLSARRYSLAVKVAYGTAVGLVDRLGTKARAADD